MTQIVFLTLSAVTILAAMGVVASRNLLRSALFLILAFLGVAGFYILLEAPFLAAVQVLLYVGAIAVLILFAIMLTTGLMGRVRAANEQWWLALLMSLLLAALLVFLVTGVSWPTSPAPPPADPIADLGIALLTTYLLPFEVASFLLLMALVGAIVIAREKGEEG